jgi:hypothetical protein
MCTAQVFSIPYVSIISVRNENFKIISCCSTLTGYYYNRIHWQSILIIQKEIQNKCELVSNLFPVEMLVTLYILTLNCVGFVVYVTWN